MKGLNLAAFIIILLISLTLSKKTSYQYEMEIDELTITMSFRKPNQDASYGSSRSNSVKFIIGFGAGMGLSVDASEDLQKCFEQKKRKRFVDKFLSKTKALKRKDYNKKEKAAGFTSEVLVFFKNFKDCDPLKETIFSFIKGRLLSVGIKGLAYILGGPIGLLLNSSYHLYKFLAEMKNFYRLRKKHPTDYYALGSSVGKIVYYTQNLLLRRRRK